MIGIGIDLDGLYQEIQTREQILDQFVFWVRYLPIISSLLEKEISSIKEYIMQDGDICYFRFNV